MGRAASLALLLLLAPAARAAAQAPPAERRVAPALAFPRPGLDDPAAYAGYATRLYRDAAGNTVQLYADTRDGRLVHLWADADDASAALTVRDADGRPAAVRWADEAAGVARSGPAGRTRTVSYRLAAPGPALHVGGFLLGTMRVERDYQYAGAHRGPFPPAGRATFPLPELERMLVALEQLPPERRAEHLAPLGAPDVATLRARLVPAPALRGATGPAATTGAWAARVVQPSLDGRDTLTLEVAGDARTATVERTGDSLVVRSRAGLAAGAQAIPFTLRVTTTARALTRIPRVALFTPDFLRWLDATARDTLPRAARADSARAARAHRLVRQAVGVELLASREKLMAGLPTYATYFGRDMLVSALMMRPIWRADVQATAAAAALRKLAADGQVSHEEALGAQAVRENAAVYATLRDSADAARGRGDRATADRRDASALAVVRDLRRVRENYHMVDDELQLAVVAGRWLADRAVGDAAKRAFLAEATDQGRDARPRGQALLRALAQVARMLAPYAADPQVANLVAFPPRDEPDAPFPFFAASWRDSGAGYGGGKWAMDVNAIWAPHALAALEQTLAELRRLGVLDATAARMPELAPDTPLGRWIRDPAALAAARRTWAGAARHFVVRLDGRTARARVAARVAAMPDSERTVWAARLATLPADLLTEGDTLTFDAVALDAAGAPVAVASTDVATRLFLGPVASGIAGAEAGAAERADERATTLRDARLVSGAYPVGLLVDGVGPVVANDAWAAPAVWAAFARDPYHGPKVVWGREVNLYLLGAAARLAAAERAGDATLARTLRDGIARVRTAVAASGFHSELWSYAVVDGRVRPSRYGTGNDVQLWSTTDLAVEYALRGMER